MARTKHIIIVLSIFLLVAGIAIAASTPAENANQLQKELIERIQSDRAIARNEASLLAPESNRPAMTKANCVVQITADMSILSLNFDSIRSMVSSSGVKDQAVRKVLKIPTDQVKVSIVPQEELRLDSRQKSSILRAFTFELNIEIPESKSEHANAFMKEIVRNLEETIIDAFGVYRMQIRQQMDPAVGEFENAKHNLEILSKEYERNLETEKIKITYSDISPKQNMVCQQLDEIVDLSDLSPVMSFAQVIESLENSVEPPLQIQPRWRDLADIADIIPTTPAEMEPITDVKLGTALDVLLAGLSNYELATIDYTIGEGVIIIATQDSLPSKLITQVYDVSNIISTSADISSIVNAIMETIEPVSWYDISEEGEGTIAPILGNKLSINQTIEIHQKVLSFLESLPVPTLTEPVSDISLRSLSDEKRNYRNSKLNSEMDIAQMEARKNAIEERISLIGYQSGTKVNDDIIINELEKLIASQTQQLSRIKQMVDIGQSPISSLSAAEEKLVQAKIDLAKRREELGKAAGGNELSELNERLSQVMIDLAEEKAQVKVIEKHLSQLDSQINALSNPDPNISKIRQAKEKLQKAQQHLDELKAAEASLQIPQVIAIGI